MDRSEELRRRRAEAHRLRRRRALRRRVGAGSVLAIVIVAAVVLVLTSLGGGSGPSSPTGDPAKLARARARKHTRAAPRSGRRAAGGSTAAALEPGTGRPGHASVPILMYHVINSPPPGAPYPGLYVNASEFAAQMQALAHAGWRGITLDQLWANWTTGARLPPGRPIVITFDNGYHSQYSAALPVLRRHGWPADLNMQLTGLPPVQGGLTTGEIDGLVRAGWELDTQGISHADLVQLDAGELRAQVAGARRTIRRRYHVPVNWFCYPSGQYDATVVAAVQAAGYRGSTTVVPGWARHASDPFTLPRLRVLGGTTPAQLLAQIASARAAAQPPSVYETS